MMNENQSMNQRHGETCNCPGCTWAHMKTHSVVYHMFKKLFILIALLFVFWLGTQLGELRALERQMHMGAWRTTTGQPAMPSGTGMIYTQ